jgi:hypothetical protein
MYRRSVHATGIVCALAVAAWLFACWTWSGSAHAKKRVRYTRTDKVSIPTAKTKKTRKPKTDRAPQTSGPSLTADEIMVVIGKVGPIRKAQIVALIELIAETDPDDPELPDLHFRLAEMYAQMHRHWHHRAMEMYTTIDRAGIKSPAAAARAPRKSSK